MARYIGNPLSLGSFRGGAECVRMTPAERARHLYVVGATRTGKSKLLEDCIRQDILAWPRSGCGMLVLDRHGSLFDNVMKWAAALDLQSWPIVPIDLRRSDWIVSYNPLRRRGPEQEQSVIVGNFVRSILHAWGQHDSNTTPRLMKWLEAILYVLHTNDFTLAEALQLIVSPGIRRSLTCDIEDLVARSVWETAPLKEPEFQEVVESTVNRVRRFLSRRVMRATLGQSHVSLDLAEALEDGQIILAAIATEGAKIDEEDASTIGSLLLSDLWMAAKCRGKRDEGYVKPFYVYLDEFQEYVTPSMAETLDQASGFGLHMTFAHQFPSQLLKSEQGKQLYNSVLANCRSKVVFQLEHNDDLETLTLMLYRQLVNVKKVKHELHTTKVLGHNIQYMPSHTNGISQTCGGGKSLSHKDGTNRSEGTNWSHTDGQNESFTETDGTSHAVSVTQGVSDSATGGYNVSVSRNDTLSFGESDTDASNWGESEGESFSESETNGTNWGSATGRSNGTSSSQSKNRSQSLSFGRPHKQLQGELDDYWDGELPDKDAEDEFKRNRAKSISITQGESDGSSTSSGTSSSVSSGGSLALARTHGQSRGRSHGGSHARGTSLARSRGNGASAGASVGQSRAVSLSMSEIDGTNHSESITRGTSSADSYGGNESRGVSSADTQGENTSWSSGSNTSVTNSPMLMPALGKELSSVTFETIDEQLFQFAQYLSGQPDRHCVVKLVSRPPVAVLTLTVKPAKTTEVWAELWATMTVEALPFAIRMQDALLRITDRHLQIENRILEAHGEPSTTGIPIRVKNAAEVGGGEGSLTPMFQV